MFVKHFCSFNQLLVNIKLLLKEEASIQNWMVQIPLIHGSDGAKYSFLNCLPCSPCDPSVSVPCT